MEKETKEESIVEDATIIEETTDKIDDSNKFIIIGGNDESMAGVVVETLNKCAVGANVYELTKEEMERVINDRLNKYNAEAIEAYVDHPDNQKQAKDIANSFYIRYQDAFRANRFVKMNDCKKSTDFSWKQFNEVIGTLDIFGYVKWEDEKKQAFKIILSDDDIKKNKADDVQFHMDIVKGKLIDYQKHLKNKKDIEKIETLKKKMTLSV